MHDENIGGFKLAPFIQFGAVSGIKNRIFIGSVFM